MFLGFFRVFGWLIEIVCLYGCVAKLVKDFSTHPIC
jgi:hypothetical protein